jgi:Domain of unknown function (DUF4422)
MRLKIFSCHHVHPEHELATGMFQTLVSGLPTRAGSSAITDIHSRNIAKAEKFCELRHQYFVWQNLLADYDYVGFEHYRRPFYLDPLPLDRLEREYPLVAEVRERLRAEPYRIQVDVGPEAMRQHATLRERLTAQDEASIAGWIGNHDVLFAHTIFEESGSNFIRHHADSAPLWEAFIADLAAYWPRRFKCRYTALPPPWSGYLNMYILRSELFDEYMDLVMTVLLDLDRRFPDGEPRVWGLMTERLFGAYLLQKAMEKPFFRYRQLPFLFPMQP